MEARINSAKNQNQAQLAIRDSISLVLFDHEVFVNLDISIFELNSQLLKDY